MTSGYTPSWSAQPPEIRCPQELARILNAAWDLLGVSQFHRLVVLAPRRPCEEWGSFAQLVRRALLGRGMGETPEAKGLAEWTPGECRRRARQAVA